MEKESQTEKQRERRRRKKKRKKIKRFTRTKEEIYFVGDPGFAEASFTRKRGLLITTKQHPAIQGKRVHFNEKLQIFHQLFHVTNPRLCRL